MKYVECVLWNCDLAVGFGAEIGYNNDYLVSVFAQICVLAVGVEGRVVVIHIHYVEKLSAADCRLVFGSVEHFLVRVA